MGHNFFDYIDKRNLRRNFLQVDAVDIDEGENARITYSIYHVSNNGGNKFTIDPNTGVICKFCTLSLLTKIMVVYVPSPGKLLSLPT